MCHEEGNTRNTSAANRLSGTMSLSAVRLSPQLQAIVAQSTPDSLIVQEVGNPAFSVTAVGDIQLSASAETFTLPGRLSAAGALTIVANPGSIVLNGPAQVLIPVSYSGIADRDTPAVLSGTLTYGATSQGTLNASLSNWAVTAGGSLTVSSGGAGASYVISSSAGNLTISPASIILVADTLTKVFGGAPQAMGRPALARER